MNNAFKHHLYAWVYEKIKSFPQKFGGDLSTQNIMFEYLTENKNGHYVKDLEPNFVGHLTTVIRIKNKILGNNPHLDCRVKFKNYRKSTKNANVS